MNARKRTAALIRRDFASQSAFELEQVIQDGEGVAFSFGRQFWRGELAGFTARTTVEEGQ